MPYLIQIGLGIVGWCITMLFPEIPYVVVAVIFALACASVIYGGVGILYEKGSEGIGSNCPSRDIRHRLVNMRAEGVTIRNAGQRMDDNRVLAWVGSADTWHHEIVGIISDIDKADAIWFDTLDAVPTPRVYAEIRSDDNVNVSLYQKYFREHDYRLDKLDMLIRKYQGIN